MAGSQDELYAQIARLPAAERLRLAARILNDLAAESPDAASRNGRAADGGTGRGGDAETRGRGDAGKKPSGVSSSPRLPVSASPRPPVSPSPGAPQAPPARVIVIDGSNLLGRLPGYDLNSAASRDKLALRLQEYAHAHPSARVTLYFDGQKASSLRRGGIEIRYSPKPGTADQFIFRLLEQLPPEGREHALLVTADRELTETARALGVLVETPESFHPRIAGPPKAPRDRGLSKAEVAEWEEYFRRPRDQR